MTHLPHIILAQLNPTVGNLSGNFKKIREVRDQSKDGDLIIFSEMITTGYPTDDLVLNPHFMDCVERHVQDIVNESKNKPAILLPTPWRKNGKLYNACHLIGDGKILATTLKHHLPNYGVFDEKRIFEQGPLPTPIEFKGTKLGIMICEDMWFPDVATHLKKQGAEILIVPNGSPYQLDIYKQRHAQASARVKETGLPLIYANQVGGQDELVFDGASFVMDKDAHITHQLPSFEECIIPLSGKCQNTPPSQEEVIYKAITLGLRDYIQKNNFPGVLIGLSGGIDSALSAALAVDAIGADKVQCVMMPSPYTSQGSLDDAAECAKLLGVPLDTISIEPTMQAFNTMLADHIDQKNAGTTFENIQSRARGMTLMALSNATGKMVLSTGNKSEMAVGYATLYGDICGGFNALKDLYKGQVYALSNWRNAQGRVIPERIITKAPSAELKPGQTDQDTLPPYEVLDHILECLIEHDMPPHDIPHDQETVMRVWRMLDLAEYKRRQAPPGVKITSKAFGRNRRYPITNGFFKSADEI
ncbi:MAG: NAD+ synthase [Alphaproteobacteria bacterium]|nr:NAD+ synthase [Alphaproteobacteria bacterium]